MSEPEPNPLLDELRSPDPGVRAAAIGRVRFRDLKALDVLEAVVRATADATPAPGTRSASADPFAAFFDDRPSGATVGELAAQRLASAGVPEVEETAALLARVLDEIPPSAGGALPATVARILGESSWPSPERAVALLVPALARHDQPLFEALIRLPSATWPVLCSLAVEGRIVPRLLQELVNHPPTHDVAVEALVSAILADRTVPDEAEAVTVLATLAAWSAPAAAEVSAHLARRFPWAAAWGALDDPTAVPTLLRWLEEGAPGIDRLWPRIAEALRHREPMEGYPLGALLRAAGSDPGVVRAWDAAARPDVAEALRDWVRAWPEQPDRAWAAASSLVAGGAHGPVLDDLSRALRDDDPERALPWDGALLEALARAVPELPGLGDALVVGIAAHPEDYAVAVPALLAASHAACARAAEAVLGAAERAPWEKVTVGPGTVREGPRGIDCAALEPVLRRLGDPALLARQDRLVPVIHGEAAAAGMGGDHGGSRTRPGGAG